jgi:hypothetical protein
VKLYLRWEEQDKQELPGLTGLPYLKWRWLYFSKYIHSFVKSVGIKPANLVEINLLIAAASPGRGLDYHYHEANLKPKLFSARFLCTGMKPLRLILEKSSMVQSLYLCFPYFKFFHRRLRCDFFPIRE